MAGLTAAHLSAELGVAPVSLSRLRREVDGDGHCDRRGGDADALLWGLAGVAAANPPFAGLFPGRAGLRRPALWSYATGVEWQEWAIQPGDVQEVADAAADYLTAHKPPLALARFLSGVPSGEFARSLGFSRQRLHLVEGRDPATDALAARCLRAAVSAHLAHLGPGSRWGAGGARLLGGVLQ